jgi:GNAT superfamily N-acetyltransferase
VDLLEGRRDLAVVWDLRVEADRRRGGVGTALWRAAESWARAQGCTHVKVETQDVNVPACLFYARQGCTLRGIHPGAYPHSPGETQLLWVRSLEEDPDPGRRFLVGS